MSYPTNNHHPQLRKNRMAVAGYFFVAGFTFASWASRIPQIQAKLGLSEAMLGTILLALPVGLMVSLATAGGIIAKFGSRTALLIAACLYVTLLPLLGFVEKSWHLVAGLFLFGMAGNLFNISVNTQAVAVEQRYKRPIMASFHGIWSLAGFSGAAFGTLMVNMQWVTFQHFIASAGLGFVLIGLFYRHTLPGDKQAGKQPLFAMPNKRILHLGLIAFGCLVCEGTMFDWSGIYFKKAVEAPANLVPIGYAAFMGCMAAGRFVADRFSARIGSRKMLQYSGMVIATGLALAVIFPTIVMATIGFMLVGFGVCSVVPIVYSLAGQSKTMHAGQALAAVSTVGFSGFLVGPPLIGFVAEAFGLRVSFAIVGLIGITTTVLANYLPRKSAA